MTGLRDYLISVISAAMISAVIMRLVNGKGTLCMITKLLCGLFIAYTAIKPIPTFDLPEISTITSRYTAGAQEAVELGCNMSSEVLKQSIKEQTQAYILDKAKVLDADLQVEVELTEDDIPALKTVSMTGKISPYAKEQLSAIIEKELGIDMEHQKWN